MSGLFRRFNVNRLYILILSFVRHEKGQQQEVLLSSHPSIHCLGSRFIQEILRPILGHNIF